jgi:hypothetical protein
MQLLTELVQDQRWKRSMRDSCTKPDNILFNELWPGRRTLSTVVLPFPGPAGRAAVRAMETVAAGRRWQKAAGRRWQRSRTAAGGDGGAGPEAG